jgi:hypothetical protein
MKTESYAQLTMALNSNRNNTISRNAVGQIEAEKYTLHKKLISQNIN